MFIILKKSCNHIHPSRAFMLLATAIFGWMMAVFAASGQDVNSITNLNSLRQAVESRQRVQCDLMLDAVICAVDSRIGAITLQDDTGAETLEIELGGRAIFPGERIHIAATRCELIRRKWSIAVTSAPVVDNGGIHPPETISGRIHLDAGIHAIRLFYYNAKNPALLDVNYSGPDIPQQPVPSSALFLESTNAGNRNHGLKYFCYEDTPSTMDNLRNLQATSSGTTTNFDISVRRPAEIVAMQFRGLIEVPRSGEYIFSTRSDDASELYIGKLNARITVLSSNAPPAAHLPAIQQTAFTSNTCEWAEIEGHVTFVGQEADGLELELNDGNHSTRLWLASAEGISPALLLNSRVRAIGAYRNLIGLDGQNLFGMMSVVNTTTLRVLGIAPEQWEKYQVTRINDLPVASKSTATLLTHLRGRVTALRSDGRFVLEDESGGITIQPHDSIPLTNGLAVEVLGNVVRSSVGLEIRQALCRPNEMSPSVLPTLTTAAQVQQLSASEAARKYPVRLRGVVTCLVEWSGAVVQDSTRGVFFSFPYSYRDGLETGDHVEINGNTAVGNFAPIVTAQTVKILGRGQFPEAVRPNWNQLISGSLDSQYAEVRGIITSVEGSNATLLTDSGKIKIHFYITGEDTLRRLQNTLIRIRGCLLAQWDAQTRQVKVGEIKFWNPKIEVVQLPMAEPFSAPSRTISDLLMFDLHASGFQSVKVLGQIVHVRGGEFFLMHNGRGLRFRPTGVTSLKAGDLVDVVGIPDLSGPSPQLHEAVARKKGEAALPPPLIWPDAELFGATKDAVRIQAEAHLIGIHHAGNEWVLELQTGLRAYRALINTPENLSEQFPLDSLLQLTGVYAIKNGERNDDLAAFELLLNSTADIRLLQRPPWWTLKRLIFIVATLIAVLTAAVVWISQLRRKVEERTKMLEREHAKREHAERERAVEFERSRIARDLHDDLGSSLTEIRVMASTGFRSREADPKSSTLFNAITDKARQLVSALDVIVWAVDPEANSLQSLADYLGGYAADYLASANISCRFKIPVTLPPATLDGRTRHDIFLAVKETLHNVVQHSRASEVEFRLRTGGQTLEIDIVDNGCGFDITTITATGHGLKNIPERLAKIGGSCEMESQKGNGTKVSIRLPLPAPKEEATGV